MILSADPKNKVTNKPNELRDEEEKAASKKEENREEKDSTTVDTDAQHYFDAQDEDPELRSDDPRDLPL